MAEFMVGRRIGALGVSILVLMAVALPRAYAQDTVISPLEPPDTSSPRATLESFRENTEIAFRGLYDGRDKMQPFEWEGRLGTGDSLTLDVALEPVGSPWYTSPWLWVGVGAAVAIIVVITAAIYGSNGRVTRCSCWCWC